MLREPLVHFLLLGSLLFGVWAALGPEPPIERRIVVDNADVARMVSVWQRQWRRPPTARELEGLIESHIREEILYREALSLGLDRDDSIVRRRLNQKMEFLAEDLATQSEPTTAELQAFLESHPERFRTPPRISLEHLFFSNDGGDAEARAAAVLAAGPTAEKGDRFILGARHAEKTPDQLTQIFGTIFSRAVTDLPPGSWQGPVLSGYGAHLVRVLERTDSRDPVLDEVAEQVRAELLRDRRRTANAELYEAMKARYDIQLEFDAADDRASPDRLRDPQSD